MQENALFLSTDAICTHDHCKVEISAIRFSTDPNRMHRALHAILKHLQPQKRKCDGQRAWSAAARP
jgi:hypothetical protein